MMPSSNHYRIEESGDALQLIMPYRTLWFQTMVLVILSGIIGCIILPLLPYSYIGGMAYTVNKEQTISLLFLPISILITLTIFSIEILWQLIGKEEIIITNENIYIRHKILGLCIANKYHADKISGVYVSSKTESWQTMDISRRFRFWNYKRGRISINCGLTPFGEVNTDRFGSILDEEESQYIVAIIQKRFPKYEYQPVDQR
jgi:hypothetical protein